MAMKENKSYWDKRAENERKWQLKQLKSDDRFNKVLDRSYQVAVDNINKQIEHELLRIGGAQNMVTAQQMTEYERLAQEVVAKAQRMREAGKKVAFNSFSPEINQRMKVYNATMRINQLELMKSEVGLQLLDLGAKLEDSITERVSNAYRDEIKRQAGILGKTTQNGQLWASKKVMQDVTSNVTVGSFSKNIWANVDLMKSTLDGVLSTAIIRGDNPREMIKYIRPLVKKSVYDKRYAAERIARTETARVQHEAQIDSLKNANYKYCKWYAEPGACKICYEISTSNSGGNLPDGIYEVDDVPNIPVHPNCRCSIGAYWPDEESRKTKIGDISDFTDAVKELGITEVESLNGIDTTLLPRIYDTISKEFNAHPQLRGYVTKIKGGNRPKSGDIAYVKSSISLVRGNAPANAKYQYEAELNLNKAKLKSIDKINQLVKESNEQHWWSKKSDYTGLIKHEIAHALNSRINYVEAFGNKPLRLLNYDEAKKLAKIRKENYFANDILLDTFDKIGISPTKANVKKYISQYAGTNIEEAFAEAYSDESSTKFSKAFNKLLDERLKKVFKL